MRYLTNNLKKFILKTMKNIVKNICMTIGMKRNSFFVLNGRTKKKKILYNIFVFYLLNHGI